MAFPEHPLAAATHANPYPYYAQLVAERPLYYDAGLKLWVAAGAAVVDAVLTSDLCGVRPLGRTGAGGAAGLAGRRDLPAPGADERTAPVIAH